MEESKNCRFRGKHGEMPNLLMEQRPNQALPDGHLGSFEGRESLGAGQCDSSFYKYPRERKPYQPRSAYYNCRYGYSVRHHYRQHMRSHKVNHRDSRFVQRWPDRLDSRRVSSNHLSEYSRGRARRRVLTKQCSRVVSEEDKQKRALQDKARMIKVMLVESKLSGKFSDNVPMLVDSANEEPTSSRIPTSSAFDLEFSSRDWLSIGSGELNVQNASDLVPTSEDDDIVELPLPPRPAIELIDVEDLVQDMKPSSGENDSYTSSVDNVQSERRTDEAAQTAAVSSSSLIHSNDASLTISYPETQPSMVTIVSQPNNDTSSAIPSSGSKPSECVSRAPSTCSPVFDGCVSLSHSCPRPPMLNNVSHVHTSSLQLSCSASTHHTDNYFSSVPIRSECFSGSLDVVPPPVLSKTCSNNNVKTHSVSSCSIVDANNLLTSCVSSNLGDILSTVPCRSDDCSSDVYCPTEEGHSAQQPADCCRPDSPRSHGNSDSADLCGADSRMSQVTCDSLSFTLGANSTAPSVPTLYPNGKDTCLVTWSNASGGRFSNSLSRDNTISRGSAANHCRDDVSMKGDDFAAGLRSSSSLKEQYDLLHDDQQPPSTSYTARCVGFSGVDTSHTHSSTTISSGGPVSSSADSSGGNSTGTNTARGDTAAISNSRDTTVVHSSWQHTLRVFRRHVTCINNEVKQIALEQAGKRANWSNLYQLSRIEDELLQQCDSMEDHMEALRIEVSRIRQLSRRLGHVRMELMRRGEDIDHTHPALLGQIASILDGVNSAGDGQPFSIPVHPFSASHVPSGLLRNGGNPHRTSTVPLSLNIATSSITSGSGASGCTVCSESLGSASSASGSGSRKGAETSTESKYPVQHTRPSHVPINSEILAAAVSSHHDISPNVAAPSTALAATISSVPEKAVVDNFGAVKQELPVDQNALSQPVAPATTLAGVTVRSQQHPKVLADQMCSTHSPATTQPKLSYLGRLDGVSMTQVLEAAGPARVALLVQCPAAAGTLSAAAKLATLSALHPTSAITTSSH